MIQFGVVEGDAIEVQDGVGAKSYKQWDESHCSEYFPSTSCWSEPTRGRGRRRRPSLPLPTMDKSKWTMANSSSQECQIVSRLAGYLYRCLDQ